MLKVRHKIYITRFPSKYKMVRKIISYFVMVLGLAILSLSLKPIKEFFIEIVPFLEEINSFILIGVGAVILVVGFFLMKRGGSGKKQKSSEVPIYQGKDVVGYRRM